MTNQQNIIQLIKQWQELAPDEVWKSQTDNPDYYVNGCFVGNNHYGFFEDDNNKTRDTIQLAIQKQVIERNWIFKLQCFRHSYHWVFKINSRLYSADATGDDLIETMLGCYVKMLGIVK